MALFVTAFDNEAFAFLLDPDLAAVRGLELAAAISGVLSEPDRKTFQGHLEKVFSGFAAHDERITTQLPDFDYIANAEGIDIKVTFPGDEDTDDR